MFIFLSPSHASGHCNLPFFPHHPSAITLVKVTNDSSLDISNGRLSFTIFTVDIISSLLKLFFHLYSSYSSHAPFSTSFRSFSFSVYHLNINVSQGRRKLLGPHIMSCFSGRFHFCFCGYFPLVVNQLPDCSM